MNMSHFSISISEQINAYVCVDSNFYAQHLTGSGTINLQLFINRIFWWSCMPMVSVFNASVSFCHFSALDTLDDLRFITHLVREIILIGEMNLWEEIGKKNWIKDIFSRCRLISRMQSDSSGNQTVSVCPYNPTFILFRKFLFLYKVFYSTFHLFEFHLISKRTGGSFMYVCT